MTSNFMMSYFMTSYFIFRDIIFHYVTFPYAMYFMTPYFIMSHLMTSYFISCTFSHSSYSNLKKPWLGAGFPTRGLGEQNKNEAFWGWKPSFAAEFLHKLTLDSIFSVKYLYEGYFISCTI